MPVRLDWTVKPPIGTALRSDGHWSVQGLTHAVVMDQLGGREVVKNTRGTLVGGATIQTSTGEEALWCDNLSGQALRGISGAGQGINTGTIVLRFKPPYASNSTSAGNCKLFDNYSADSTARRITVYVNPSPGRIDVYNEARYTYYPYTAWTPGRKITLALVYDKDTDRQDLYIDGVKQAPDGTTPKAGSWATTKTSAGELIIGNRDNLASQGAAAPIYSFFSYNRQLSLEEIQSLTANPWQIYEPQPVWALPSAAASGITGTMASTEAVDTAAMTGTVAKSTTTGTMAVTEGTDTSAASGTVTKSTLTGTFAATEVADTIAVSGTVGAVVAGTLAVTEGTDTAAVTGTVTALILGTLDATEAIDTAAASGTVVWDGIVRGIMEALEGADVANCRGVNHYRWTGPIILAPGTVLKAVAVKVEKEIKTQQYTAPIPVGTGKTVKYRVVSSKGQVGGIVVITIGG